LVKVTGNGHGKGKGHPIICRRMHRGGIDNLLILTSPLDGTVRQQNAPAALFIVSRFGSLSRDRLVGPTVSVWRIMPPPGIGHRNLQPAASLFTDRTVCLVNLTQLSNTYVSLTKNMLDISFAILQKNLL